MPNSFSLHSLYHISADSIVDFNEVDFNNQVNLIDE